MANILIVDDEPVIRKMLEQLLREQANHVLLAGSAQDALVAATRVERFDVALVDKNLPDRSGLELISDLKAIQPDAEVILITAFATLDSAIEAMAVGATDYLLKPFRDIRDVKEKVRRALSKAHETKARRSLMQCLLDTEDTQRTLFESMLDAGIVFDADTRQIEDANRAALQLYQYSRPQLLKLRIDQLRVGAAVDQVVRDVPYLRRDLRRDGSRVTVEVTTSAFTLDNRSVCLDVIREVRRGNVDLDSFLEELRPVLAEVLHRDVKIGASPERCVAAVSPVRLKQALVLLAMYASDAPEAHTAGLTIDPSVEVFDGQRCAVLTISGPQPAGENPPLAALHATLENLGATRVASLNNDQVFTVQLRLPSGTRVEPPVSNSQT